MRCLFYGYAAIAFFGIAYIFYDEKTGSGGSKLVGLNGGAFAGFQHDGVGRQGRIFGGNIITNLK